MAEVYREYYQKCKTFHKQEYVQAMEKGNENTVKGLAALHLKEYKNYKAALSELSRTVESSN